MDAAYTPAVIESLRDKPWPKVKRVLEGLRSERERQAFEIAAEAEKKPRSARSVAEKDSLALREDVKLREQLAHREAQLAGWDKERCRRAVIGHREEARWIARLQDANLELLVQRLRLLGATWGEVGEALGTTRQTAWQQYAHLEAS